MTLFSQAAVAVAIVAAAAAVLSLVAARFVPRRTLRIKLSRLGMYALLVAAIAAVAGLMDWPTVHRNFWAPGWREAIVPMITTGAVNTIKYTAIAFVGGLILAIVLALMKLSPVAPYRWLATAYIELFRGLPALVVIFLMAFGIPIAFQWTPPGGTMGAGLIGLIIVSGAYMAETLRAGIQAVPKGQNEAARSLGMTPATTMASVVMPQALRIVIPPLTNEFVLLIKDTALLFVAGAMANERELTSMARDMMASGPVAATSTALTIAALLYLVITLPLTRLVAWMEKKQQRAR